MYVRNVGRVIYSMIIQPNSIGNPFIYVLNSIEFKKKEKIFRSLWPICLHRGSRTPLPIPLPVPLYYWVGQNFHSGFHKIAWKKPKKFLGKPIFRHLRLCFHVLPPLKTGSMSLHSHTQSVETSENENGRAFYKSFRISRYKCRASGCLLSATSGFCKPNSLFHSMCLWIFHVSSARTENE